MTFDLDAFFAWLNEREDFEEENGNHQAAQAYAAVYDKLSDIFRFIGPDPKQENMEK